MIKKIEIDGETIYLRKSKFYPKLLGWKVVYPHEDENGNIKWFNLITGGWPNLITLFFIALISIILYLGIKSMVDPLRAIAENPLEYCRLVTQSIWR